MPRHRSPPRDELETLDAYWQALATIATSVNIVGNRKDAQVSVGTLQDAMNQIEKHVIGKEPQDSLPEIESAARRIAQPVWQKAIWQMLDELKAGKELREPPIYSGMLEPSTATLARVCGLIWDLRYMREQLVTMIETGAFEFVLDIEAGATPPLEYDHKLRKLEYRLLILTALQEIRKVCADA